MNYQHIARETYNIRQWSGGYFDINTAGQMGVCTPPGAHDDIIPLIDLVRDARQKGLNFPLLMRFSHILRDRIQRLTRAFEQAMQAQDYTGQFLAVYPIKANQQRSVVQSLLHNKESRVGLEVGSRAELMAVLALFKDTRGVIVCNGYKDHDTIQLALIGQALGHQVTLIIEKLSELPRVLDIAQTLGIRPKIGLRVRLAAIAQGKWQNTGGEKAKFGLTASQILQACEALKAADALDCLTTLHCHMGSQVANIRDIQAGVKECARIFVHCHELGARPDTVDVGGGLGVDYEGTASRSACSMNYSIDAYAVHIVSAFKDVCQAHRLPYPNLMTEAGRAMTAHHALLVTNVIDVEAVVTQTPSMPVHNAHPLIHDMYRSMQAVNARSVVESYHDAQYWLSEVHTLYTHGVLTLKERALAEQLHAVLLNKIHSLLNPHVRAQRDILDALNEKLANKMICNFSVFRSMPDVWAIDQIFPIMPLSRLNELLCERARLYDITCDSDGRIDYYIDNQGIGNSLPMPAYDPKRPFLMGVFLLGAYQETLGDIHNLFGGTNSVQIDIASNGAVCWQDIHAGDKASDVLANVDFAFDELLASYQHQLAQANLSEAKRAEYAASLKQGLFSYTYLG